MNRYFGTKNVACSILLAFIASSVVEGYIYDNEIEKNGRSEKSSKYNPDIDSPVLDMIIRAGYPAEAHAVVTADGYILTVHRIPGKFRSTPIFLQHGLLSSSADWVISGKSKALAYLLADRGYDVWLGNARGNTYSRNHVKLSTKDPKFWDFSWDEMGLYDLPAAVEYIAKYTKDSLIYIGHSMGTTMFYVMASRKPEIAKLVKVMISLAPVAYVNHIRTPIRIIAPLADKIEWVARYLGADEFLPQTDFLKFLAKFGCEMDTLEEKICTNSMFVLCGFDQDQFNTTLMPVILSHSPAGTSTKTLIHYGQEINSGQFRAYDYGPSKNRQRYNDTIPPIYDVTKIRVPVAIFVADNDWLSSAADVDTLFNELPNKLMKYRVPYPKFNHLDFLWGVDAPKLVYHPVISVIDTYRRKGNTMLNRRVHHRVELY